MDESTQVLILGGTAVMLMLVILSLEAITQARKARKHLKRRLKDFVLSEIKPAPHVKGE